MKRKRGCNNEKRYFLMFIAILLINACTNTSVPFNEVESSLNQKVYLA